jgi:formylglycine-generating enzyme required for sulfatase activity
MSDALSPKSGQIFISYRREDSSASAERLFDILRNHFAANQIFMDEKEERLDAERREERAPRVLVKATKEQPWQNSLGMKFVPVAGTQVLFNIWDTRLEDFHAFVESAGYDATEGMYSIGKDGWKRRGATWKEPGFKQGPTNPVVGVSWNDVKAFCEWLTKRERGSGALPESMHYRLPTDTEWSVAVGLDSEPGNTPEEKSSKINLYPWGTKWPPPSGSGNYCGEEARIGNEPEGWPVIQGYNDGYPRTSPVGSFAANKNGLYNMGGNVWQWCEDWYNSENKYRVLRGASWSHGYPQLSARIFSRLRHARCSQRCHRLSLLLWLGSLCEQAPFKPIAQNFLLSISSRRIEAISVTSSFLNSRTIGFKSRGLSFHVSELNGAKEGCQAAHKGDFLRTCLRMHGVWWWDE